MSQPRGGAGTPGQAGDQPASPAGYGLPADGTGPGHGYPTYAFPGNPRQGVGRPELPHPPSVREGLAQRWRRLLARLIDVAILAAAFAPLWIPPWSRFFTTLRSIADTRSPGTDLTTIPAARTAELHLLSQLYLVVLLFCLVAFGYDWIQHGLWGQTVGKRVLGIVVVREQRYTRVSSGAAAGRAAIYALTPPVPVVGWMFDVANTLWLTWDPRRQCVHDKAANTVVVMKSYLSSRPPAGDW